MTKKFSKNLKLFIIIFNLFFNKIDCQSYNVSGYVSDELGETMADVVVVKNNGEEVIFTNSYGYFNFTTNVDSIKLSFSSVGYISCGTKFLVEYGNVGNVINDLNTSEGKHSVGNFDFARDRDENRKMKGLTMYIE